MGSTNLRTAFQAAGAGDTVNFSTVDPTNMNGQETSLIGNIALNNSPGGSVTLDTTGLSSAFTVDGSGQLFPPYALAYQNAAAASLRIVGNGKIDFRHGGIFNIGTGTLTVTAPVTNASTLTLRQVSAFANQASGGGHMNIQLDAGNYIFNSGSGIANNGSGTMNLVVNGGSYEFPLLSGITNASSNAMTIAIQGGDFTFTGGSGFGAQGTGAMDITITGGSFTSINNAFPDFVNLNTGVMTINFQGGTYSLVNGEGFVNPNNGTMTVNITGGTILMDQTGAACGTTLTFSNTLGATSIFHTGPNGVVFGETAPNGVSLPGNLTFATVAGGTAPTHRVTIGAGSQPVQFLTMSGQGAVATLGGAILDVVSSVPYKSAIPATFTILSADSGSSIVGTYGTTTSSSGLPSYIVTYTQGTTKNVEVTVEPNTTFRTVAQESGGTPNAIALATYLDSLSNLSSSDSAFRSLNDLILAGDTVGYEQALNIIQPSQLRVSGTLAFNSGTAVTDLTNTQLRNRFQMLTRSASPSSRFSAVEPRRLATFQNLMKIQYSALGAVAALVNTSRTRPTRNKGVSQLGFTNTPEQINRHPSAGQVQLGKANIWVQPYGQLMSLKATQNNPGLTSQLGGIAMGADYEVAQDTFVGLLGGTATTPFKWSQGQGWGTMNSGYGVLYAGWQNPSGFYADGQLFFGGNKFKTNRIISYSTINRTAAGNHSAFQFTGNLELGCTAQTPLCKVQPFIMGDYLAMQESGYTETGAGSLNMVIKPKTSQFLQWDLGVRAFEIFSVRDMLLSPSVELGWVQRRPLASNAGTVAGGFVNQAATLVVTGTNKVYNQIAPGVGVLAQFANGLYASTNLYAECGGGLAIGEALVRLGYEF